MEFYFLFTYFSYIPIFVYNVLPYFLISFLHEYFPLIKNY